MTVGAPAGGGRGRGRGGRGGPGFPTMGRGHPMMAPNAPPFRGGRGGRPYRGGFRGGYGGGFGYHPYY